MISSVNSSLAKASYPEAGVKPKEQEKPAQQVSKQGDTSRIEELKASIERGEYRVDIEELAKRIAQALT